VCVFRENIVQNYETRSVTIFEKQVRVGNWETNLNQFALLLEGIAHIIGMDNTRRIHIRVKPGKITTLWNQMFQIL
jgi:hypothetical protein